MRPCRAALATFLATREGAAWCEAVPGFEHLSVSACDRVDATGDELAPSPVRIFAAFAQTPPDLVRVVILGQDPYPTPGHANGLAFSHIGAPPLPRSLGNIFKELQTDQGVSLPSGDLGGWASQGVLLLNTALTVAAGSGGAGSHLKLGWQALTDAVIRALASRPMPAAFVLWGDQAKAKQAIIGNGRHLIVASPHPSPLSARRGFFGSRPFGRINAWLKEQGEAPIDWSRPA